MISQPGEFNDYLQGLIDRHERDLSIILNSLGMPAAPTPESLIEAYRSFPIRFTQLLTELDPPETFMGFSFDQLTTPGDDGQTALQKLFQEGTQAVAAINAAKSAIDGKNSSSAPATPAPEDDGKGAKKMVIIVAVVIIVLVGIFVAIKFIKK